MNNTMEYRGYVGSVEFSEEDGLFYGKVMGIRALISYEGSTAAELTDNCPSHVLLIPLNSHLLQFYFVPYLSSQQPFYWIYDIIQYLCNISQCFFLLSNI